MAKRARKKADAGSDRKKKAKSVTQDSVLDAALRRAAANGWRAVSLDDIAVEAACDVAEAEAHFATKRAVVRGLLARVDARVTASLDADPVDGSSVRDRLFDVLMRRFDALAHSEDRDPKTARAGMVSVIRAEAGDPKAALCLLPRLMRVMAKALDTAGPGSRGPCGGLRVKGLALVYGDALRAFVNDDGADMAKTMAALDRGLKRAESAARLLGWTR